MRLKLIYYILKLGYNEKKNIGKEYRSKSMSKKNVIVTRPSAASTAGKMLKTSKNNKIKKVAASDLSNARKKT